MLVSGTLQWTSYLLGVSHKHPERLSQQRQIIRKFQEDPTIVIFPADKGRATMMINKEEYVSKMQQILEDGKYTACTVTQQ